jgi:hypothetical protein
VDSIPRAASGKFRMIVNEVPADAVPQQS